MNPTTDWYDARSLDERSYLIWELDRYAAYLLEGETEALLVDTGCGIGDIRSLVEELTDRPVRVLITHSHWDHIGNAAQFNDVMAHPRECAPDGSVAIDGVADDFVHRPSQVLSTWRDEGVAFPDGFNPNSYSIDPVEDVQAVYAGDVIELGGRRLELLALPGHSPGQIGLLDRDQETLYGADIIGGDRRLLAHFSNANLVTYLASIRLVRDLYAAGAFHTLATGHNAPISGTELDVLEKMVTGLEMVVAGDRAGRTVETRYGPAHEYSFDDFTVVTRE